MMQPPKLIAKLTFLMVSFRRKRAEIKVDQEDVDNILN